MPDRAGPSVRVAVLWLCHSEERQIECIKERFQLIRIEHPSARVGAEPEGPSPHDRSWAHLEGARLGPRARDGF